MCYPAPHVELSSRVCSGGCWFFDHFTIDAFVVLPDHLHAATAARRLRFLHALAADQEPLCESAAEARAAQRRSRRPQRARHLAAPVRAHLIRDETDHARHVEYCYINPLKHRLVTRVHDWPYSSFHRDVRAGVVPEDWAGDSEASGEFGER
jgi:putative transposase